MVRPFPFSILILVSLLVSHSYFHLSRQEIFSNIIDTGIYYSFFEAFPLVYVGIYGFSIGQLGIVFTCIVVGSVTGIIIYCSYLYFYLEPDIKKNGLRAQEHRLVPGLFAVTLMPAGMFWFAWTAKPEIHWIVSIIGITFYGVGAFILYVFHLHLASGSYLLLTLYQVPMYLHVFASNIPAICSEYVCCE